MSGRSPRPTRKTDGSEAGGGRSVEWIDVADEAGDRDDEPRGRGREDAERLVEEGRGDDSELASYLRIVKRELEGGGFH